ncbi:carbohydrate esterase family 16 protein [Pseudocercospora fijiensis CIRAD86]|uniref:Carbohydrate esterase family 16 protein n=1 Tax=Pseudocercospora fijiensis (strain CIRAD86) TaxID=383855 RepID=M3A512_PSEFD|nr:carbohydrate esterase family 16 protein [Pseudocercospora fijiensis CIRAD86]EME79691.1 carbohydrate esterase family 16 protein [Pseudocercospora fijiensis CIRAD86]
MSLSTALELLLLAGHALASPPGYAPGYHGDGPWGGHPQPGQPSSFNSWDLKKFTTLVTFGDSYTDDSRLGYFSDHDGQAPPVGWVNPTNYHASDGGRIWPQYVKQYSGVNLYNYAVSGAVCSNNITPRTFSYINAPFPAVEQYEIPAYIADSQYIIPSSGQRFLITPSDETVYSMWIGTNDLGNYAFISDSQVKGTNIVNYTDCVYAQLQRIYENGGRYFVLQNVAPLNLAPLYATPENGGLGPGPGNQYWPDKPSNSTEISYRMEEEVVTVNRIYDFQTPFEVLVKKSMPEAKIVVMDMHGLISDIYYNPAAYLNGTAPLNVTGYVNSHCNATGQDCMPDPNPDSFLWYDALHPSEQADRIIAREFVDVVNGGGRWGMYWG